MQLKPSSIKKMIKKKQQSKERVPDMKDTKNKEG